MSSLSVEDRVWITTARDSLHLVERVLGAPVPMRDRHDVPAPGDEVALLVPRAALADISAAQHEEHHRCGGFMLQEGEAEAMAALHAERPAPLLAPVYTLDNQATVKALLPEAKEPNVLATIRKLASYRTRFHTSSTGEQAALYIRDSWQMLAAGRDDIEVALVDHEKTPQSSVRMTIRGSTMPEQLVVLGGHLDSISGRGNNTAGAPGADDNASGIACLTEIARAAVALDYKPERTVVFYGYAAEEIGLVGSAEIAAAAKAEALDVYGVMQLDMTNYTSARTPYIGVVTDYTDAKLNSFSTELIETYLDVPYKLFECGYGCSDHASWDKYGFPAMAPHEANMEEANQRIHTTGDTLSLSNDSATHAMHFVHFGLAFMAELAKGKLVAEPICSATKPCPAGERCEAALCVPEVDAAVDACATTDCGDAGSPSASEHDASTSDASQGDAPARDAGKRDAGREPSFADTPSGEQVDDQAEPATAEPLPPSRAGGCSVTPSRQSDWTLCLFAALLAVHSRRARRRRYG